MNSVKFVIAVVVVFALSVTSVQAAQTTEEGSYLLLRVSDNICVLTQVVMDGESSTVYQKIYSEQGTSGPNPEIYRKGNEIGDLVITQLFAEADYQTDFAGIIAVNYGGNSCTLSRFVLAEGQWVLYQNIVSQSGEVTGPNPSFVQDDAMRQILMAATDVFATK